MYEDTTFCLNVDQCDCADSSFCDPQHIFRGDLQIIKNKKLRKFLRNVLNYREHRTIKFSETLVEITTAIDTCIQTM